MVAPFLELVGARGYPSGAPQIRLTLRDFAREDSAAAAGPGADPGADGVGSRRARRRSIDVAEARTDRTAAAWTPAQMGTRRTPIKGGRSGRCRGQATRSGPGADGVGGRTRMITGAAIVVVLGIAA